MLIPFLGQKRTLHKYQPADLRTVVKSTTSCPIIFLMYYYPHTMIYSAPIVPIGKLLWYNHRQGGGKTQCHIVGSYPQHYPYCIIFISGCTTHMILSDTFLVMQHFFLPHTVYTLYCYLLYCPVVF